MFFRWIFVLLIPIVFAATTAANPAEASRRLALVIGNSDYDSVPLANPVNDARLMADALEDVGFEVTLELDLEHYEFGRVVSDFGATLSAAGDDAVGLFYYAGHAIQADGRNYLIPTNAQPRDVVDLQFQTISMDIVLSSMNRIGPNGLKLIFLDSCRDNPFAGMTRSASRGLSRIENATGTFISYATAPGQVAEDGTGQNSPFARSLARRIQEPNLLLEQVMRLVRLDVMERTGNRQEPWTESSLGGDFYFLREQETQPTAAAEQPIRDADVIFWESIRDSENPALYDVYLQQFPDGQFAALAQARKIELNQQAALQSQAQAATQAAAQAQAEAEAAAQAQAAAEAQAAEREQELAAERQRLADLEARVQQLAALQQQGAAQTDSSSQIPAQPSATRPATMEEAIAQETERFLNEVDFTRDGEFLASEPEGIIWIDIEVEDGDISGTLRMDYDHGPQQSWCSSFDFDPATTDIVFYCGGANFIADSRVSGSGRDLTVRMQAQGRNSFDLTVAYQLTEADHATIRQRAEARMSGAQQVAATPSAADLPEDEAALRAALLQQETERFMSEISFAHPGEFFGDDNDFQFTVEVDEDGDLSARLQTTMGERAQCAGTEYNPGSNEFETWCGSDNGQIRRRRLEGVGMEIEMSRGGSRGQGANFVMQYQITSADQAEIDRRVEELFNQEMARRAN